MASEYLTVSILIVLAIYGIILFIKSKDIQSKSLKAGILIPLIIFTIGIVWWAGDHFFHKIDFGGYIIPALLGGWLPSILSIIFSAFSLLKSGNKTLPILAIIYGIIYFSMSLLVLLFGQM